MAHIDGLWPPFRANVLALVAESKGKVGIASAFRPISEQQVLWDNEVAEQRRDNPTWSNDRVLHEAGKWVARPGQSNHGPRVNDLGKLGGPWGIAVDFSGDLALAHSLAPRFQMHQAMTWEAWHFEPDASLKPQPLPPNILTSPSEGTHNMITYDPISGGNWTTDITGAIFAHDGAPFIAGLNAHPDWHAGGDNAPCVGVTFWKGDGTDKGGNGIVFATRPPGSPQPNLYHIARNGQPH